MTKKNRKVVVAIVDHGEVGRAVAVEISHCDCDRFSPGFHLQRIFKRTVAVALEVHDILIVGIGYQDVRKIITVHVIRHHRCRFFTDGIDGGQAEWIRVSGVVGSGAASARQSEAG